MGDEIFEVSAARDLAAGHVLTIGDLTSKRPGGGITTQTTWARSCRPSAEEQA